jgi:hypothetical protein
MRGEAMHYRENLFRKDREVTPRDNEVEPQR